MTKKIDVEGLAITITSAAQDSAEDAPKPKSKGKSKAKAAGRELISDGHLRLKGGVHYGLIGRNGTGKSSKRARPPNNEGLSIDLPAALLRAMAEKLIPGIPHPTRIAILQQTQDQDESGSTYGLKLEKTVLESVLGSDESRNEAVRLSDCISILSPMKVYKHH